MKRLAILGSTGSIGQNALAVVDAHADRLQVVGLAAGENADLFAAQIARYRPAIAAMASGSALDRLKQTGVSDVTFGGPGRDGLVAVASHPDVDLVLCASAGTEGLEVIEAHWLFGVRADQIEVVVHPQSVVHSMVELIDGSIIAQLGVTDMRLPIQYAFSYPERWPAPLPPLDLTRGARLEFDVPDTEAFPCLRLAYRALDAERSLPVVLNAANEVAVSCFLDGKIGFRSIPQVIELTMDAHRPAQVAALAEVRAVDEWAHEYAQELARGLELKVEGL